MCNSTCKIIRISRESRHKFNKMLYRSKHIPNETRNLKLEGNNGYEVYLCLNRREKELKFTTKSKDYENIKKKIHFNVKQIR